jgi:hypothetical protein
MLYWLQVISKQHFVIRFMFYFILNFEFIVPYATITNLSIYFVSSKSLNYFFKNVDFSFQFFYFTDCRFLLIVLNFGFKLPNLFQKFSILNLTIKIYVTKSFCLMLFLIYLILNHSILFLLPCNSILYLFVVAFLLLLVFIIKKFLIVYDFLH